MRNSIPQAESRRRQHSAATSSFSNAATALLPVLACFLGGATEKWAEGIVVAFLRFFATGIVILAAISILFYWTHLNLPFWLSRRGFGPFPNRNQTADLFGLTAVVILACGQDDFRKGKKRWTLWVLALGIIVTALILSSSR